MTNTTPTSTTFSLNAGEFITRAYTLNGFVSSGDPINADQVTQGIIAFNLMLKAWQEDGTNLWRQERLIIDVEAGQGAWGNPISLDPLVMDVSDAYWVTNIGTPQEYDRQLGRFSRKDYNTLPNKYSTTSSGPYCYYFDRQENASNLYIFMLPQFGGQMALDVARSVLDITQSSDTVDIPAFAQEAVLYGLADRLMDDEAGAMADPATSQRIERRAAAAYEKLLDFDRPNSLTIKPAGRKGASAFWK